MSLVTVQPLIAVVPTLDNVQQPTQRTRTGIVLRREDLTVVTNADTERIQKPQAIRCSFFPSGVRRKTPPSPVPLSDEPSTAVSVHGGFA